MPRRRITLRESFRKAWNPELDGPGVDGGTTDPIAAKLLAPVVAVWFWIVGEPA